MQNESIEAKQQYLRQNIIDAGYDAEDFVQYCSTHHELSDLGDWKLQKLRYVVQLYIAKEKQSKQKMSEKPQQQQWSNFEEASNQPTTNNPQTEVKKQHQANHNTTKSGNIVFSEDDWAIFLGSAPSQTVANTQKLPVQGETKKTEIKYNVNKKPQQSKKYENVSIPEQKPQISPKKLGQTQKGPFQIIEKQNPLSPPSQETNKQVSTIKSMIDEGAVLKNQNRGPINFTNIKLQTSRVKQMPKLVQINDIEITKTQQVSRNFLQSDYTVYYIHFLPGNHTIQRKFSDLRKLRSLLHGLYPHIRLPFLEPQGWLTSSQGKDTQTLAKYKWMVLDFLKYIMIRNEELKNCPLVRRFCGFATSLKSLNPYEQVSKQQLKHFLQTLENLPKPKCIGELCLTNNFIILPPTNDGQKTLNNTTGLMQQIDHEYQKLKKKLQSLFYYYDCLAKAMSDVAVSFESLENLIKKYNYENDEPKEFRVYEGIREMCNKMHNSLNEQCVIFKTRIKNILRFEKDNMMTLKQLFDNRNKVHNEYGKQGYPTLSKSNQSSVGQVQIQSNISIEQPCKHNKNLLCVQEIFWSHSIKTEINAYFEELRRKINEQLTMIAYEELDNQNDNLNFWNSMIKKSVV